MKRGIYPAIALLLTGCGGPTEGQSIFIQGVIDEKLTDQALARLDSGNVRKIFVKSPGGDALQAMRLGRAIKERNIEVHVRDYCNSACAQYVFIASDRPVVERNAVVLFHGSMRLKNFFFKRRILAGSVLAFKEAELEEMKFYDYIGRRKEIADLSFEGIEPVCVGEDVSKDALDPNRYFLASVYDGFMPSRKRLERLNILDLLRKLGFGDSPWWQNLIHASDAEILR